MYEDQYSGVKSNQTKALDHKEIAKLIRADIKAAFKKGLLPEGLKVTVRARSSDYTPSLVCEVTAVPAGFEIVNRLRIQWERDSRPRCMSYPPDNATGRHSEAMEQILQVLESIANAYNWNKSDGASDYYHHRFFCSAGIQSELYTKDRERVIAEIETYHREA